MPLTPEQVNAVIAAGAAVAGSFVTGTVTFFISRHSVNAAQVLAHNQREHELTLEEKSNAAAMDRVVRESHEAAKRETFVVLQAWARARMREAQYELYALQNPTIDDPFDLSEPNILELAQADLMVSQAVSDTFQEVEESAEWLGRCRIALDQIKTTSQASDASSIGGAEAELRSAAESVIVKCEALRVQMREELGLALELRQTVA
jgi:hypothetical protein